MIHSKHLSAVLARGAQRCPISPYFCFAQSLLLVETIAGTCGPRRKQQPSQISTLKQTPQPHLRERHRWNATVYGGLLHCAIFSPLFNLVVQQDPIMFLSFTAHPKGGAPLWKCRNPTRVIHEDSAPSGATGARREFLCVLALHFSLTYTAFVK